MKKTATRVAKYALLIFYAAVSLYPLLWLIFYSFKDNNEIFFTNRFGPPTALRVENYARAWQTFNMPVYFRNSLVVTALTVIFTLLFAVMFSYAASRLRLKFVTFIRVYIGVGMFIPVQVILVPVLLLMKSFRMSNSLGALVTVYVAFQLGFSTTALYGFFKSIPTEIEEAALIDGAGIYKIFTRIILPIVSPAISSTGIFLMLTAWNEFPVALVMLNNDALKTLPLGLINFQGQFHTDWGAIGASLVIASLPTIVLYLFLNERVERAMTVGSALKG